MTCKVLTMGTILMGLLVNGCGGSKKPDQTADHGTSTGQVQPAASTPTDPPPSAGPKITPTSARTDDSGTFKIGLMTGTVSQGEDEYRAAQMMDKRYPGRIKHVTYPDNFMNEQETTIARLTGLATDPDVKVIIAAQAVPGSLAALRKIREARPDIKIAFMEPHEDPAMVNAEVDVALQPDQLARGETIINVARKMNVTHFVHYSFPRHMSQELTGRRKEILEKACAANGIEFHFVTAPDPMAEGGLPATQQFVLEDIPREVGKYGKQTAFFSTNCGMMDPIIRATLAAGAYFPEQCCPSPTHGYPTALGISVPEEKSGDFSYINAQNKAKIAEAGMGGHFATWPIPVTILQIHTLTDFMVDAVNGKADYNDQAAMLHYLEDRAGVPITLKKYDETKGSTYFVLLESIYY